MQVPGGPAVGAFVHRTPIQAFHRAPLVATQQATKIHLVTSPHARELVDLHGVSDGVDPDSTVLLSQRDYNPVEMLHLPQTVQ